MPNGLSENNKQVYDFHFRKEFEGVTMGQEHVEIVNDIVHEIIQAMPLAEARQIFLQIGFELGFEKIMEKYAMPIISMRLAEAGIPTNPKDFELQSCLETIKRDLYAAYSKSLNS